MTFYALPFVLRFGWSGMWLASCLSPGEHIDYSGYAVLPMAIQQDVLIAAATTESDRLHLANIDPAFEDRSWTMDWRRKEDRGQQERWDGHKKRKGMRGNT